jgi:hypothetical protein
MPRVGFEPAIPVFKKAKIVHASDHAVIVIVKNWINLEENFSLF